MTTQDVEQIDQIARREIRENLTCNFLVEAAAGTGKTAGLVDRMVNLVATGSCHIEQLVAVTFTRKAASELQERFRAALREALRQLSERSTAPTPQDRAELKRLRYAVDHASLAFVGTIHSFCAKMLRERPIEFGVAPAFRELDEEEDFALRKQAWQENLNDLMAADSPLMQRLAELGVDRNALEECFHLYLSQQDVDSWPVTIPQEIDVADLQAKTEEYLQEMRSVASDFPVERGNDKLMTHYERLIRASDRDWSKEAVFFRFLEQFDRSVACVLKNWSDKAIAKHHKTRWAQFREDVAKPGMRYWTRLRYKFVLELLQSAAQTDNKLRLASAGLSFDDLLRIAAAGLKESAELRTFFQSKHTHILVDEFQDTDPLQAELLLFLTSRNPMERDWTLCEPKPGALFLVGDPKQSIYRFRRGDIVTYNKVQRIFAETGGIQLALVRNYRSCREILDWNNQVFRETFPEVGTPYSPARRDMIPGRKEAPLKEDALSGVLKLTLPSDLSIAESTLFEARRIAEFIRHAIDSKVYLPRATKQTTEGFAQPRDFLVIPHTKKRMAAYQAALEEQGIPYEVAGGNALQGVPELQTLLDCLRTIEDPRNPVHLLVILRRSVFALTDQELYDFKAAGGSFNFLVPIPASCAPKLRQRLEPAFDQLKMFHRWLRQLPFSTAIHRVAEELGLIAKAASGNEGHFIAGSLLKALEMVRSRSLDFDSTSDAISCLEEILANDETTGCSALPHDGNVVRLMNLHKAKGLEAPVVFLANTASRPKMPVRCHIDRSGPVPDGYIGITAPKGTKGDFRQGQREIATPDNWDTYQQEEQQFLDAEEHRLLYVAATRAANCLVVSQGNSSSRWSPFHRFLTNAKELPRPVADTKQVADSHEQNGASFEQIVEKGESLSQIWTSATQPSYEILAAKKIGLQGKVRPNWQASGDYGVSWGSALHDLLELAACKPEMDLRATARALAGEYSLGVERVDELLETAQTVARSDVWLRSQSSKQRFVEIPFDAPLRSPNSSPTFVKGVIDLVFQDSGGWVIVDYKTDDISRGQVREALEYYHGQLSEYAAYWESITDSSVCETGIYFTRINAYFNYDE